MLFIVIGYSSLIILIIFKLKKNLSKNTKHSKSSVLVIIYQDYSTNMFGDKAYITVHCYNMRKYFSKIIIKL